MRQLSIILLLMIGASAFADRSRYPYGDFRFAGEWIGLPIHKYPQATIGLNIRVDPTFDQAEKNLIRAAMAIFIERALQPQVIDCAFDQATKDFIKDRSDFVAQLEDALGYRQLGDLIYPGYAYISRFFHDRRAVGIGYINLFYKTDDPFPGYSDRHYFYIALNSDFMGPGSRYQFAKDEEYWAGVIAHEFLHNLGYTHPTGYTGSFVKEYGQCVASNGTAAELPGGAFKDWEVHEHE